MTRHPHPAPRPLKALALMLGFTTLGAPAFAQPTPTTPPAVSPPAASTSRLPLGRLAFLDSAPEVSFWLALDDQVRTGDIIDVTLVAIFDPAGDTSRYLVDRLRIDCKAFTAEALGSALLDGSGALRQDDGPLPVEKIRPDGVISLVATAACSGKPGRAPVLADAATARAAFIAANAKGRRR